MWCNGSENPSRRAHRAEPPRPPPTPPPPFLPPPTFPQAIAFFAASTKQTGEHHVTAYNLGICKFYAHDVAGAHAAFARSVELRADYGDASLWLERCATSLASSGAGGAVEERK